MPTDNSGPDDNQTANKQTAAMRKYSHAAELIDNIPYAAMIVLGTVILAMSITGPTGRWLWAGLYLIYGLGGAVWIIVFVCPFCRYYDTRSCPCGYGQIAPLLRTKNSTECFSDKFKKHIPVIVPLWFIPLLVGVPVTIGTFSWAILGLLILFSLDAFVVLPLLSTKHGCKECPQKESCPWMSGKTPRDIRAVA
jgi:hypothetical protein